MQDISYLFQISNCSSGTSNDEDRMKVSKKFKRLALGLCGERTEKSFEQLACIFFKAGIASSYSQAMQIVSGLKSGKSQYAHFPSPSYICIERIEDEGIFKVYTFSADYPGVKQRNFFQYS